MSVNKILLIILVFQFGVSQSLAINVNCDRRTEQQMDDSLAKILIVGQKRLKFPENGQQLSIYCNDATRLFKIVSDYTKKCLTPFGRDSAAVLLHSVNNELRIICKNGRLAKKAKELLAAAPCANAGLDSYQKCNIRAIDAYMAILNVEEKLRIPMACCNFHQLRKCLINEAEDIKQCTRRTIDFVDKYISKMFEGILSLLCAQYDESNAKCDQLVEQTPKRDPSVRRYKSLLMPTFNIAMSLKET